MERARFRVPQKRWGTLVTKYAPNTPQVGPDDFTSGTKNADTDVAGVITKRPGDANYEASATTGTIRDFYEAIFQDGVHHLLRVRSGELEFSTGSGTFSSITPGYSAAANFEFASYLDRLYFDNGVDNPQTYDRTTIYGGVTYTPGTITIVSFAGLAGDTVTIGTSALVAGVNWTAATSNDATATSLAAAIDALTGVAASAVGPLITITSTIGARGIRSTDTTNLTIAAATSPRTTTMGVTAPGSALSAATGAAGNVPIGTYTYKVTFLYYGFEESNGGTASGTVSPGSALQINLTSVPLGGYGVTARKIYRSSDSGLSYRLVLTISDNTATTGTDNSATGTTLIPTDNGTPRIFGFIVNHLDRNWVAGMPGDRADLDYSAAGLPDVFPTTNTLICNTQDNITGLCVYNQRVMVFNRTSFGYITGTTPETFRYNAVPGNIGCVDNRTIQIRTLAGVPILMWLSTKGFYAFNGSSVDSISDGIENLISVTSQVGGSTRGAISQTSQTDFSNGTSTGAIDIVSNPGAITTINPKQAFSSLATWQAGITKTNIQDQDTSGNLKQVVQNTFTLAGGAIAGDAIISGGKLTLPVSATTQIETLPGSVASVATSFTRIAEPFVPASGGWISSAAVNTPQSANKSGGVEVWSATGSAPNIIPNAKLGDAGDDSLILSAGTIYFLVQKYNTTLSTINYSHDHYVSIFGFDISVSAAYPSAQAVSATAAFYDGSWHSAPNTNTPGTYTLNITASKTGSFLSAVYDTKSTTAVAAALTFGIDLADGSVTVIIQAATASNMVTGLVEDTNVDPTSPIDLTGFGTGKRYWRIKIDPIETDENITVPSVDDNIVLTFADSATWVSTTIDNTLDNTALNTLLSVLAALPTDTDLTAIIQKSTAPSSGFVDQTPTFSLENGSNSDDLGTVTDGTQRYTRIKLVFGNTDDMTATASLTSLQLNWTVVANFFTAPLDTGAAPVGWDVFQATVVLNGGLVAFEMRANAVDTALTDDVPAGPFVPTFTSVVNGGFPTGVALARYAQWRATITSTADHVPTIDSGTINWFITGGTPIRAASLFDDTAYYCSLASVGATANDFVLKFDFEGSWKKYEGQSVGAISLFFGDPYYAAGNTAQVRRFLTGTTDHGTNISLDVRLKAFDFEDLTKQKLLRQVFLILGNTGATYTVDYSIDNGLTFINLVDDAGSTSFTLASNAGITTKRLVPPADDQLPGKTILVRIREATSAEVSIHEVHIEGYMRKGDILNG